MPEKAEIPEIRGGIAASGVAFSYRDGRPVLRGVDGKTLAWRDTLG